jgi:Flp pilus assembly protein TadD
LVFGYDVPSAQSVRDLFAQGQAALENHRDQAAFDVFRRLLAEGVRSAPVYSNLGVACLRLGWQEKAIAYFKEAKKLTPSTNGIDLNLGLAFYRHHDFEEAVKQFTVVLAEQPQNMQAHYLCGVSYYMLDEYRPAVNELIPLEDRQGWNLEYFFVLGVSLGQLKRLDESRHAFGRMIEIGGDIPQLHVLLAQAYLALSDDGKALQQVDRAISADPHLSFAHYYRGIIRERNGQKAAAMGDFQQETKLAPNEPWSYEHLGSLLLGENRTHEAISILRDGVYHNPDVSKLLIALAKAYLHENQAAQALPLLLRALTLEPRNGSFHYQIGRTYAMLGDQVNARKEMQLAAQLIKKYNQQQVHDFSADRSLKQPTFAAPISP